MPKIEELHRSQQPTCPRVWQARILKSKMNSGIGATSTHGDKHVHRSGRRQNFKIKNWGTSSSCMYVEPPIQDTIFITLVYPPCTQCSDYVTSVYPLPEDARRHHHRLTRDSMNESPPCCACVDGRVSMMNLPRKETEIEAGSKQFLRLDIMYSYRRTTFISCWRPTFFWKQRVHSFTLSYSTFCLYTYQ
jgi:hypothetical protein